MSTFTIEGKQFLYNGSPVRIIGGAMHYYRIVPQYWKDRLLKLKACGFNTVETCVPWNLHEPEEGRFNFEGIADITRFIELAHELGLFVIIRPSPYTCAEWEFGGFPAWLLQHSDIQLRSSDPYYLEKVDHYYDVLMEKFRPYLCTQGGPIIAMQIENEYGSYGNDKAYLEHLRIGMIKRGIDVLLFTSDGPTDYMLQGGTLPNVLATVNFGSRPEQAFDKLLEYQPDKPVVCMEYWNGWFDHWGEEHHVRDHAEVAEVLDRILAFGASVNFYMFHGGTNFGFYNGANYSDKYEPTVTSYDYHALLNEAGDITEKYLAIREVIGKYVELPDIPLPAPAPKMNLGPIQMTEQAGLFEALDRLSQPIKSPYPVTMEKLGQDYGFILYETNIPGPLGKSKLAVQEIRDRALVYLNGEYQGVIDRNTHDPSLHVSETDILLEIPKGGAKLSLLVENMGRINYGWKLKDPKGITEGVRLGQQFLYDWTIYSLPLKDLSALRFEPAPMEPDNTLTGPRFHKATITLDRIADTFLQLEGWTKGAAYINGFNLGRYWEVGPQKTLYVPAPLLREGDNELILFELHGTDAPVVCLQDVPDLG
ncbi:glycoside hydrolase family 35 protein [Paenibacillus aquistagni]|uniref:glycoside hydrolase family 35 protein n=1 Tax=Paenibacillus aquistagni TaxID=1852522 RepID=UPI00145C104F|nr:beta-galactosidase family protein [Paenibacillus aquistagni]NMM50936.1 beta-galactosidase [Paenibacillus aquistagni]